MTRGRNKAWSHMTQPGGCERTSGDHFLRKDPAPACRDRPSSRSDDGSGALAFARARRRRRMTVWEAADERQTEGETSWWSIWPWKIKTIMRKMELPGKQKFLQGKSVRAREGTLTRCGFISHGWPGFSWLHVCSAASAPGW